MFPSSYLDRSPRTRRRDTRAWRHLKANSGDSWSSARVSLGFSLKKVGTGPVHASCQDQN